MSNHNSRELVPGLIAEDYHDGEMVVLTANESSRTVVDAFVNFYKDRFREFPDRLFEYALIDYSQSFAAFNTPYAKAKMSELMELTPSGRISYTAIVTPRTFATQLGQIFLRAHVREGAINRIFFSRQEGMTWLEEMYKKHSGMDGTDKNKDR